MIGGKKTEQISEQGPNIYSEGPTNIIINNGESEKRIREISNEVIQEQKAILTREALEVFEARSGIFDDKLISELREIKANIDAFKEASVQFALHQAKIGFAESGDLESCDLSIEMLSKYISNESRYGSEKDIIREAIKVVPIVPSNSIKLLSLHFILTRLNVINNEQTKSAISIWRGMQAGFKIYLPTSLLFDSISRFDLDILDMRGIIRINDFNHFSFDDWVGRLGSKLRQPVGAEFVKKYPKISESGHLEKISENFYYSKMAGALPSHPVIGLGEHEDALREAEQIHRASADENTIEEILCADAKVRTVKSFLSKIERNFDVTPVGKALATSYLRTHGIPIDDDFWLK